MLGRIKYFVKATSHRLGYTIVKNDIYNDLTLRANRPDGPLVPIYTLPKSGTHFVKAILDELQVNSYVAHCFKAPDPDVPQVNLKIKSCILIRDPRAFFVSLARHCDRICKDNKPSDVFPDVNKFEPWLKKSIAEKLQALITLDDSIPYVSSYISNHFGWITVYFKHKNIRVLKFEEIIGSKGGGSDQLQLRAISDALSFCGVYVPENRLKEAIEQSWGHSLTFDRASCDAWRKDFDEESLAIFYKNWGYLLDVWGYKK